MSTWSDGELRRLADVTELQLASRRSDGTLRSYTTMWVVRAGDELYVRSAGGPDRPWYRHAVASGRGRIRAGAVDAEVALVEAGDDANAAMDDAYHTKYDRFGPGPVSHVTGPGAHAVSVRLERSEP